MRKETIFREATKQPNLRNAWYKVLSNGLNSKSEATQKEVKSFKVGLSGRFRSLQRQLRDHNFEFKPAKGVRIPKKSGDGFRPLIVAPLETRIVQRSVLDQLQKDTILSQKIHTPFSFGGVERVNGEELSAVPAAIKAVLDAKRAGLNYVHIADISNFFTQIQKSSVLDIIAKAIDDEEFLDLLENCLTIELSNLSQLGHDAARFPRGDLGVAQGSALSPFMGNLLLHEFDVKMNQGDCRCIRYIDDMVILAPNEKAANARLKMAVEILDTYGMKFATNKSSKSTRTFNQGISFLGVELINGLIRPANSSCRSLKKKLTSLANESVIEFNGSSKTSKFDHQNSLIRSLTRLNGTLYGWSKHYRFCNDHTVFANIDQHASKEVSKIISAYRKAKDKSPEITRSLLGVVEIALMERQPFSWPTET